jgi:hypothetical protein
MLLLDGTLKALALLVRVSYFVTCALALAGGLWLIRELAPSLPPVVRAGSGMAGLLAVAIVIITILGARALLRLSRGKGLIPQRRLEERWDVAVLVAGASVLGNLLSANMAVAMYQVVAHGRDGDGMAALLFFITILYAIALLCGEIVMIGRHRTIPRTV